MYCLNLVLSGVYFSHQERRLCGIPQAVHRHWKAGLDLGTRLLVPFGGKEIQESGVSVSCGEGRLCSSPQALEDRPKYRARFTCPPGPFGGREDQKSGMHVSCREGRICGSPQATFSFLKCLKE